MTIEGPNLERCTSSVPHPPASHPTSSFGEALMCAVGRVLVGRHDFLALSSVRVGEAWRSRAAVRTTCARHVTASSQDDSESKARREV